MLVACLGSISVLMRLAPEKKRKNEKDKNKNNNKMEKKAKQESGKLAENKMAAE